MSKLDTKFFKPFIEGTLNTLKVQCKIDVTPGKPFIKEYESKPDSQAPRFDIAGVIGITSVSFVGTITLCFTQPFFLKLMGNMVGEELTTIDEDVQSGAAELLNIIFGAAKVVLNQQGYTIQQAIPAVVLGNNIQTIHLGRDAVFVLPFESSHGTFHIQISSESSVESLNATP